MNRIIAAIALIIVCSLSYGQSVEIGFVKEYNGERAKTPLAGVELSVSGAPSTISDSQGRYELRFAVHKPGEAVRYNEIYKSGFVIFNVEALKAWRISNTKKPFVIVMCKESAFRDLKKKFYGIIEKSYKKEYERQKQIARQKCQDVIQLERRINEIENEYQEKLSNINSYVEIFARIDRSEMDEKIKEAIKLIEAGDIEDGIRIYQELQLTQKAEEQVAKLESAESLIKAGEQMKDDAVEDLVTLAEKLKQQVFAFNLGGSSYDSLQISSIQSLVNIYRKLNQHTSGTYGEEEGMWMIEMAKKSYNDELLYKIAKEASRIPSVIGLLTLGDLCLYRSLYNVQSVEEAKKSYIEALNISINNNESIFFQDSIKNIIESLPDFYDKTDEGDTLCYKFVNDKDVCVWPRNAFIHNIVGTNVTIPAYAHYNGNLYKVSSINAKAFQNNKKLETINIPNNVVFMNEYFNGCTSLRTIIQSEQIIDIPQESKINTHSITVRKDDKENHIQNYIDIAQLICKDIYNNLYNATEWPEYEELLSIGIIAIQIILKNQSAVQTGKYNTAYVSTALKWTIENEMSIRYPWYKGLYSRNYEKSDNDDENYKNAVVRTQIYRTIWTLYTMLFNKDYNITANISDSIYVEIREMGKVMDMALKKLPTIQREILEATIINKKQVDHTIYQYNISATEYCQITDSLKIGDLLSYRNKALKIPLSSDSRPTPSIVLPPEADEVDVSRLIGIVQVIARIENETYKEIEYEELLSIGIIAIQVMFKNKSHEQIESFDDVYIATALRWAIENEMKIRYKQHGDIESFISESDSISGVEMKKLNTRYAIYRTIGAIHTFSSNINVKENDFFEILGFDTSSIISFESKNQEYVTHICRIISSFSSKKDQELIKDVIFGQGNIYSIAKKHKLKWQETVTKSSDMLDTIKSNLDMKGLKGF